MIALAHGVLKSFSLKKKMNKIGKPDNKSVTKVRSTFS